MREYRSLLFLTAVLALSCGGSAEPATPEPQPTPQELAVPQGVTCSEAGVSTLKFKWDPVSGAESYGYRLLKGMTLLKEGSVQTTETAFDGLEQSTLYRFAVKSLSSGISSAYSGYIEATTTKEEKPSEYPDPIGTPEQILLAMKIPSGEADDKARAFPGAQGGGMWTTGGRGGQVIHVTNLEDSGDGSLRAALKKEGARTIVFDVAGIIDLKSKLEIKNGDVTIAGQTAPGDGICLKGYNFRINAGNVIIRYIRCRMGDETATEDDALNCFTGSIPGYKNIIVDHCSLSWSTDECGSFYGVTDFTLQYCILSESLCQSVHAKGSHGYGGIWGGENASYHHNLLAHHTSRNPRFDHDYVSKMKGPIHFYNNVIYNWGDNTAYGGEGGSGQEPKKINMVNNYYKPGDASSNRTRIVNPTTKCSNCNGSDQYDITPGLFYVDGNFMDGSDKVTADNWEGVEPDDKSLKDKVKASSYQGERPTEMESAREAFNTVIAICGASLRRDEVDTRIAKETKEGTYTYTGSKGKTKGIIDSQEDVGGWPSYTATEEELKKVTDSDSDGIPDWYEALLGLDMKNPEDAAAFTIDGKEKRYSNLELYMHYLVKDIQPMTIIITQK